MYRENLTNDTTGSESSDSYAHLFNYADEKSDRDAYLFAMGVGLTLVLPPTLYIPAFGILPLLVTIICISAGTLIGIHNFHRLEDDADEDRGKEKTRFQ